MGINQPFTIRNFPSDERYSIEKFLNFQGDCYDCISSPFLLGLKNLPVASYYNVNDGYNVIDQISYDAYETPFYAYYIMFYNNLTSEVVPENTTLNMFSLAALDNLVYNISNGIIN